MFIEKPNLPDGEVTAVLLSPQYEGVVSDIRSLGIEVILTDYCGDIQPPVGFHADILCHHLGLEKILVYPYSYPLCDSLEQLGMKLLQLEKRLSSQYPHDILLAAARVGNRLICNKKYTADEILSAATYTDIIDVPQGYAKCSTLVVDDESIITSDRLIYSAWQEKGLDALLISEGGIRLDGYDYGFIGGTGAKLSKDKIYFTGRLAPHRDGEKIRDFIIDRGIAVLEGSYDSLVDIGGILPLLEE